MNRKFLFLLVLWTLPLLYFSCNNDHHQDGDEDKDTTNEQPSDSLDSTAKQKGKTSSVPHIELYIENSGSMFGYVSNTQYTDFQDMINNIVYDNDFLKFKATQDFFFINGKDSNPNKHFTDANKEQFMASLSPSGMKSGNYTTSDINGMLKLMLKRAKNDTLAILFSDGIFDVGSNNMNVLKSKGAQTKQTFYEALQKNNSIQTLVVKMESQFDGNYCYATQKGSKRINQKRPYYIWIFGKQQLLNRYFPDKKIANSWPGYKNHARFQVTKNSNIPFKISGLGITGKCKIHNNELHNCGTRNNAFGFSIIVDYSSLVFSDDYLMNIKNYTINNFFKIETIKKADSKATISNGCNNYKRPYIITVKTDRTPGGTLDIKLTNKKPAWIDSSSINNENAIDSTQTFGFATLMGGIVGAYSELSSTCPASFRVIFK